MPPQSATSKRTDVERRRAASPASARETESMALTSTSASASDLSPSLRRVSATATTTTTVTRKRARESMAHRSSSSSATAQERSPSAPVTTTVPTPLPRSRRSDSLVAGLDSARRTGAPRLSDVRRSGALRHGSEEEEEVFFEAGPPSTLARASTATVSATAAQLQHTPTSQLLSQHQAQPYASATTPEEAASDTLMQPRLGHWQTGADLPPVPPTEQALFATPATVARRVPPQTVRDEVLGATASASSSASRPSSHDDAVQAILRANPPTTTRPVTLRPGYAAPSPHSPLWAALDSESEAGSRRGSGSVSAVAAAAAAVRRHGLGGAESEEEETLLSNTQVSLFQFEDDDDADVRGVTATAAPTHLRRQALAAQASISLPAPGRSLNLLDEDGLHEDDQTPFFVSPHWEASAAAAHDDGEGLFSLTQEAARQDGGGHDQHAALPRSRRQRAVAAAGGAALATPSPPRRSRVSFGGASPFSQLQREVEGAAATEAAMGGVSNLAGVAGGAAAHSKTGAAVPSQRELRRRAEMLKWAERTRAFFHFIDTRPLHVTTSPVKLPSPSSAGVAVAPQRRNSGRSQSTATVAPRLGVDAALLHKTRASAAASMSLVRRSHSGSTVTPQQRSTSRGSTAFAAVVSRVKREAAAVAAAAASARSTATSSR